MGVMGDNNGCGGGGKEDHGDDSEDCCGYSLEMMRGNDGGGDRHANTNSNSNGQMFPNLEKKSWTC